MNTTRALRRQILINRVLLLGLFACVCALLVGQTSTGIQPTITCRGVKVVDPQGRVRGAFMMANGQVSLRTFHPNGEVATQLRSVGLSTFDDDGTPGISLEGDQLSLRGEDSLVQLYDGGLQFIQDGAMRAYLHIQNPAQQIEPTLHLQAGSHWWEAGPFGTTQH